MKKYLMGIMALSVLACDQKTDKNMETKLVYPETRKDSAVADNYHGMAVSDPYRWLEDDLSEETANWVAAQNKVSFGYLEQIPFRKKVTDRLTKLWNYEKFSAPFKEGEYTYFYKNDGLQNQSVLYRQKAEGEPEMFLDPNKFSPDGTTSLAGIEFTEDGELAAYQISEAGSDWRKVIVINTETREVLGDTLIDVKFSGLSWRGNEGFYYSSYDKPAKGSQLSAMTDRHKLFFHELGTPQSSDKLIFGGNQTPRRYIGGYVTEDQNYLVISAANSTTGNELYIQDLKSPKSPIRSIVTGFDNNHALFDNRGGKLFIETNLSAPNRKVVVADISNPGPENWTDLIPEKEMPLDISSGGGYLFASYLKDATTMVKQYDMDGKFIRDIKLPAIGTAGGFGGKADEKEMYFTFTNYIYAPTIFKYNPDEGTSELYKKPEIAFNPDEYISIQVFYPSKDGTEIPMILTYKRGIKLNGKNPVMLYGYGGFNISLTPSFSTSRIVWMENGGIYAVANLRGGGEYGKDWHTAGTKMNKQNVFDDFIAAAEYLIREKYTSPEYLAINGGSNGGLLVGACMTQRPELFAAAIPEVGVLDMLRYNAFTAGAGWAYDYGTAQESEEMFRYLLGYSPVHNVKKDVCYPPTMIMTGDHDDRVVPAHSFKFAAELQDKQSCNNPVIIRIETNAGHGAGKPTDKIIQEQADKWCFAWYSMGVNPFQTIKK
jgi:prolyl oligopeptidase